jgi:N-ethylmaleimide reductase
MDLFSPFKLGKIDLANRMVMAPMTRSRAVNGNVPNPLAAAYYAQRAGAGLIITEAAQVSPQGVGYIRTPGIHSPEQVVGWKRVTEAAHKAGGKIFLQLWHVGRVSHPDFHGGNLPVAPSALPVDGETFTPLGKKKFVLPRALELKEIPGIIEQYRQGAVNAKIAGFDGVEIHGANGYLLDQFLRDGSNKRSDEYGGSLENRVRLPLEVTRAVIRVWGTDRVGYRISPYFSNYSMSDSNLENTFVYLADKLNGLRIAYLHHKEDIADPAVLPSAYIRLAALLRKTFKGAYMLNSGYDLISGNAVISGGQADLVAFGKIFLANPDLVERFKTKSELNAQDVSTFYSGEEKGYVDYPCLTGACSI